MAKLLSCLTFSALQARNPRTRLTHSGDNNYHHSDDAYSATINDLCIDIVTEIVQFFDTHELWVFSCLMNRRFDQGLRIRVSQMLGYDIDDSYQFIKCEEGSLNEIGRKKAKKAKKQGWKGFISDGKRSIFLNCPNLEKHKGQTPFTGQARIKDKYDHIPHPQFNEYFHLYADHHRNDDNNHQWYLKYTYNQRTISSKFEAISLKNPRLKITLGRYQKAYMMGSDEVVCWNDHDIDLYQLSLDVECTTNDNANLNYDVTTVNRVKKTLVNQITLDQVWFAVRTITLWDDDTSENGKRRRTERRIPCVFTATYLRTGNDNSNNNNHNNSLSPVCNFATKAIRIINLRNGEIMNDNKYSKKMDKDYFILKTYEYRLSELGTFYFTRVNEMFVSPDSSITEHQRSLHLVSDFIPNSNMNNKNNNNKPSNIRRRTITLIGQCDDYSINCDDSFMLIWKRHFDDNNKESSNQIFQLINLYTDEVIILPGLSNRYIQAYWLNHEMFVIQPCDAHKHESMVRCVTHPNVNLFQFLSPKPHPPSFPPSFKKMTNFKNWIRTNIHRSIKSQNYCMFDKNDLIDGNTLMSQVSHLCGDLFSDQHRYCLWGDSENDEHRVFQIEWERT